MEQLESILFIDIETVSVEPDYGLLSEGMQTEWTRKTKTMKGVTDENASSATLFAERAGIFSEFAKVVCISFGSLSLQGDRYHMRLKSIAYSDEKKMLNDFCEMLTRFSRRYPDMRFCGHNIKEFDLPFISRRMIINSIGMPACLQLWGKKPWEVTHLDTMEMWKFGDFKHFTSLSLLAQVLGIPTPKDDMDGSMVSTVYWRDHDLARISKYCQRDVLTTAKVFLRLRGISDVDIEPVYVESEN